MTHITVTMTSNNPNFKTRNTTPIFLLSILLLTLVSPAHAFFRHLCFGELGTARVDPIVAPGRASQHAHVIFGASSKSCLSHP